MRKSTVDCHPSTTPLHNYQWLHQQGPNHWLTVNSLGSTPSIYTPGSPPWSSIWSNTTKYSGSNNITIMRSGSLTYSSTYSFIMYNYHLIHTIYFIYQHSYYLPYLYYQQKILNCRIGDFDENTIYGTLRPHVFIHEINLSIYLSNIGSLRTVHD